MRLFLLGVAAAAATAELTTGPRMATVDIDYAAFVRDHTPGGTDADNISGNVRPASEGTGGDERRSAVVDSSGEIAGAAGPRHLQDPNLAVDIWNLFHPMSVTWDNAGHVIIAEKAGILKIVDGWKGEATRILLDVQNEVASYGDHGLNHAQYFQGYIWLAYMKETAPFGDNCRDFGYIDRPLPEVYGCKVTGRISRFPYDEQAGVITGPEQVVIEGADNDQQCGQFSTHGMTMVIPGPDNHLYISAGDGASFAAPDIGQMGNNPCNDPPEYPGAFRSQNPDKLAGKIIRLNPTTLEWEIYASGVRNPFRLTWYNDMLLQSDTGWYTYEEINHIQRGKNYGWPCYEGPEVQDRYILFQHPTCAWLAGGQHTPPLFAYKHPENAAGDVMSISAIAGYNGRIYYGDYTMDLIASINLDGSDHQVILRGCYPVGLYASPMGLIYINYNYGQVRSIPAAGAPVPSPSSSPAPIYLIVNLRGGSWTPASGKLVFDPDSNIEGREGAKYTYVVRLLFDCGIDGGCKVAELFTAEEKHPEFNAPPVDGTMEVVATAATYKGTSITVTARFPSVAQGPDPCTCPGERTVVPASSLGIRPSATPSPSFRPGFSQAPITGRGANDIISSKGFVGGISAAGAVVGVAALVAAAWFAGLFGKRGGSAAASANAASAAPPAAGANKPSATAAAGGNDIARPSSIAARRTSFPGAPPVATGAEPASVAAAAPARGPTPANGNGAGRTPGGARVV